MSTTTSQALIGMRSITARFDSGWNEAFAAKFYPNIAQVVQSKRASEEYAFLGAIPQIRKWLGARMFRQLRGAHFDLLNEDWENSLKIKKTDLADDVNGFYGETANDMGIRAAVHPDNLIFDLINAGDSTVIWDGQFFFDTDHAWGSSGQQSNDLASSATAPAAPTTLEFKTSYNAARTAIQTFKDDQNQPLYQPTATGPNGLYVVVPPGMEQAAREAVGAAVIDGTTNIVLGAPTVFASPLLTDPESWYMFNNRTSLRPFVFQERLRTVRDTKGADDQEFKFAKFMTYGRYNAGYLGWHNAIKQKFS